MYVHTYMQTQTPNGTQIYHIRQNFRGGKLSRLCTKYNIHWKTFAVYQAVAIMYCTQQVIQGENFCNRLKIAKVFPLESFAVYCIHRTHTHIHTRAHACAHSHMCTHTHAHTHTYIGTCIICKCTYIKYCSQYS